MNTVAFYTLGCKVNQYETEAMEELFEKSGYHVIDSESKADIYVINTCTVTNLGDRKSRQFIRKAKRKNPKAMVAVVGCYAQTVPEEVSAIDEVDVILGTKNRHNIVAYVEEAQREKKRINAVENIMETQEFEELSIGTLRGKTRAFLKIQEGCNQYCTYCIIPYARGPIRSRQIEDIVREVERLANNHFKEIVLTGIHVASYGKEKGNRSLIDVIRAVHPIDGIERIRLSSIEPTIMTETFVEELVKMKKVCPHFHLSLQSGCDETLARMNRKYTTDQYKEIIDRLRKYMPDVSITTDIMVGFPGETEEEFEATMKFVEEIGFSQIHVFKYSPRRGTPALKYRNQVPSKMKNIRSEKLIDLAKKSLIAYHNQFLNSVKEVLFENASHDMEGYYEGLTDNYIRVLVRSQKNLEGKLINVKLKEISGERMIGELMDCR